MSDVLKNLVIEMNLREAKKVGLTRAEARALVEEIWPPRLAAGMVVTDGWEMPSPPIEGVIPCFTLHGGDGWELYWWHPGWSEYSSASAAYKGFEALGLKSWACEIETDPLENPDTGGLGATQTEEALRELGFRG